MSAKYILAIDQGTHSTRAVIYDGAGKQIVLSRSAVQLNVISRTEIEQSPDEILESVTTTIAGALDSAGLHFRDIKYIGIATQRSSVMAWHRENGDALSPVLSWQDLRTETQMARLHELSADIHARTGLRLSAHYGAGKIQWLLTRDHNVSACVDDPSLVVGPLVSFLVKHLLASGDDVVDDANASRTLLWNIETGDWDPVLLDIFKVKASMLPECRPIQTMYGRTRDGNIPVTAVSGDQTAALYAHGMPKLDTLIVNIGTGAFVLLPTGHVKLEHENLLTGISMSGASARQYYLEGTVNGAAAALEWGAKRYDFNNLESMLPGWLDDISEPPIFINTIGGLGAPWWKPGPEPVFSGATPDTPQAAVAIIESIIFHIQAIIILMQKVHPAIRAIRISGGLANLDGLCQRLASLSGIEVTRPAATEATARGIAWLAAGEPVGWDKLDAPDIFIPASDTHLKQRYQTFIETLTAAL